MKFVRHSRFIAAFVISTLLAAFAAPPSAGIAARAAAVDEGVPDVAVRIVFEDEVIDGAFVALELADPSVSETVKYAGITEDGGFGISGIVTGTYTMSVSYNGAALHEEVLTLGVGSFLTRALTTTVSAFRGLGAYGAQVGTVVADGRSGTFYLNTTGIPSLFRTTNYGGYWAPVTPRTDSSARGLSDTSVGRPATSGFPGEVAVTAEGKVWYSRDFGNTWDSFPLPSGLPGGDGPALHWGRVGGNSVLLAESAGRLFWAAMPTLFGCGAPTGMAELLGADSFYRNAAIDKLDVANGGFFPTLAVASSDGNVVLWPLVLTGACQLEGASAVTPITVTGFPPQDPTFVRIGGPSADGEAFVAPASGGAPTTILVYANGTTPGTAAAAMAVYESGWDTTTATEFRQQASDAVDGGGSWNNGGSSCGGQPGSIGALAPAQKGVGTVSQCWVTKDGATLVARFVQGINNNTGFAFDADYDGATNMVVISGDGENGAVKSAYLNPTLNRPMFGDWPQLATSGILTGSGGLSLRGVRTPVVRDTAIGPNGNEIVTVLSFTGGGRVLGSVNSGKTFFDLPQRTNYVAARGAVIGESQDGGMAVDWWRGGAGGYWLLVNAGGGIDTTLWLTDTDSITKTSGLAVLRGSRFGAGPEDPRPIAIGGVPNADVAYIGLGDRQDNSTALAAGGLYKVAITGTEGYYTMISQTLDITRGVPAIDACGPTSTSAGAITDTVFAVVTESANDLRDGTILRYSGATGTPVSEPVSVANANFRDVRASCDAAVVWAAAYVGSGVGLFQSLDGGATFTQVTAMTWTTDTTSNTGALAGNLRRIETLAISPDDVNIVTAVTKDGDVISTDDGGATWRVVNNTADGGKRFGSETPGDIEITPAATGARGRRAAAASSAVFGSSGGMYEASLQGEGEVTIDAPTLNSLNIGVSLSPAFSSGQTSYTATVPNGTSSVTVAAISPDAGAVVSVTATPGGCVAGVCQLQVGVNTVTVRVTTPDVIVARAAAGRATTEYVITVTRLAATPTEHKVYVPLALRNHQQ
jgi:hypothetical protein